jgi:hypothetical protein
MIWILGAVALLLGIFMLMVGYILLIAVALTRLDLEGED